MRKPSGVAMRSQLVGIGREVAGHFDPTLDRFAFGISEDDLSTAEPCALVRVEARRERRPELGAIRALGIDIVNGRFDGGPGAICFDDVHPHIVGRGAGCFYACFSTFTDIRTCLSRRIEAAAFARSPLNSGSRTKKFDLTLSPASAGSFGPDLDPAFLNRTF